MTAFTEVLNNPEAKEIVSQIEDISSSLEAYPEGEEVLEEIKQNLVDELFRLTDFAWVD